MKKLGLLGLLFLNLFSYSFTTSYELNPNIWKRYEQNPLQGDYQFTFRSAYVENNYSQGSTIWVQDLDNNYSIIEDLKLFNGSNDGSSTLRNVRSGDNSLGIYISSIQRWYFIEGWKTIDQYTHNIIVDNNGPEVSFVVSPVLDPSTEWFNSDVFLKATPDDSTGTNIIESSSWNYNIISTVGNEITISKEGINTLQYKVYDAVKNLTTVDYTIRIDKTNPTEPSALDLKYLDPAYGENLEIVLDQVHFREKRSIKFSWVDSLDLTSGISKYIVQLYKVGTSGNSLITFDSGNTYEDLGISNSYDLDSKYIESPGQYFLSVYSEDLASNVSVEGTKAFTIVESTSSGIMTIDEIWEDGHFIDGVLTIPAGINLVIRPGAKIEIRNSDVKIIVKGSITLAAPAAGLLDPTVSFVPGPLVTTSDWKGISIEETGSVNLTDFEIKSIF